MLRGHLTAQLPLQACLTCRARLAHAFTASALVGYPLAVLSNDVGPLTPFRAFAEIATLFSVYAFHFRFSGTVLSFSVD